jgi:hypothetical protein
MTGEEKKRNLALGRNDREGSLTDDDPGILSTTSVNRVSGDDGVDTEPLFKKVILKKRHVESRRMVPGGECDKTRASKKNNRNTQSD